MTERLAGSEVVIHPVPSRFAQSLRVQIEPAHRTEKADDPAADAAWAHRCGQNPKLFDGPILVATQLSLGQGVIRCARDSYRRLALRDELKINLAILSVTAVLEAADESGRVHVLLGRRGRLTRSYPGMWEVGPAGGLDVPPTGHDRLGYDDVMAQVNTELHEETGIGERVPEGRIVAIVFDPMAGSYDIVVRSRLDKPIEQIAMEGASEPWEYSQTQWLALDGAPAFLAKSHDEIIGPTRALLGWLGDGELTGFDV